MYEHMHARIYITGIGTGEGGGQAEENVCHPPPGFKSLPMHTHTQNAYFQSVLGVSIHHMWAAHKYNDLLPPIHPHMISLPCKQFLQLQTHTKYKPLGTSYLWYTYTYIYYWMCLEQDHNARDTHTCTCVRISCSHTYTKQPTSSLSIVDEVGPPWRLPSPPATAEFNG